MKRRLDALPDGTDAGCALYINGKTTGSNSVLARPYSLHSQGHIVDVWSDDDRTTRSECSCGAKHGPFHSAEGWHAVWSAHTHEVPA